MTNLKFYGGIGTIGGNIIIVEDEDSRLLLDFGMDFRAHSMFYHDFLVPRSGNGIRDFLKLNLMPRLDGIYADDVLKIVESDKIKKSLGLKGDYLYEVNLDSYEEYVNKNGKPFVDAVIISHVHLDHCGYIWALDPRIEIYVSDISEKLLEILDNASGGPKLTVYKKRKIIVRKRGYFPGEIAIVSKEEDGVPRKINVFKDDVAFKVGKFEILPIYVDHSIPGASAFIITDSHGKKIAYTGDFRFHGRRNDLTEKFREKFVDLRPDALIIEGTRINDNRADDELQVEKNIMEVIDKNKDKLIFITFTWKDLTRYQTVRNVCAELGKIFVIPGKMAYMLRNLKKFSDLKITDPMNDPVIKVYLPRKSGMIYLKTDYVNSKLDIGLDPNWKKSGKANIEIYNNGIKAYEINEEQHKYVVFIDDYSLNEMIDIDPHNGAIYIRAISEAYSDEGRLDEKRILNWLKFFNINPPDNNFITIHASGHISGLELSSFINEIQPKQLFPIHTEHPDLFSFYKNAIIDIKYGQPYLI